MIKMLDFFNIVNKRWATYKDVKEYLKCSNEEAFYYIQVLQNEAKKKNLFVPETKMLYVPMEVFVDYFNIDINLQKRYHDSLCECGYI